MAHHEILQLAIWGTIAYLAGSISFSIVASHLAGKGDIRDYYSKNAGTMNIYRLLGWRWALLVLVLDVGRGALVATLTDSQMEISWMFMLVCACLLIGNILPVFHGFRGGKGVATSLGLVFGMNPWFGLVSSFSWIGVVMITGRASIGSLVAMALFPLLAALLGAPMVHLVLGVILLITIILTHHKNIARILKGSEPHIIVK